MASTSQSGGERQSDQANSRFRTSIENESYGTQRLKLLPPQYSTPAAIRENINNFEHTFLQEAVSSFSFDTSTAKKIFDALVDTIQCSNNENVERQITQIIHKYMEERDSFKQIIPIIATGKISEFRLSRRGYFGLTAAVYLQYLKNKSGTEFQCSILKCPFHRIVIDCDIKDYKNESLDAHAFILNLMKPFKLGKLTTTRRQNHMTQNFHIISERQFDYASARHIITKIASEVPNNVGITIDVTNHWAMPTGRCHVIASKIDGGIMDWEDFKAIGPLDVWRPTNFYTYLTSVFSLSDQIITDETMIALKDEEWTQYVAKVSSTPPVNFFKKFYPFKTFEFKNFSDNFTLEALITLSATIHNYNDTDTIILSDCDEIMPVRNGQEFHEAYYESKIVYKYPLSQIFGVSPIYHTSGRAMDGLRATINDIDLNVTPQFMDMYEYRKNFTDLDPDAYVLSAYDQDIFDQATTLANEAFTGMEACIFKLLGTMEAQCPHQVDVCLFLFYIWCRKRNMSSGMNARFFSGLLVTLAEACDGNVFEPSARLICSDFEPNAEPRGYTHVLKETCSDPIEDKEIIIQCFRSIISTMLDHGYVTSILSMFIECALFKTKPLASCIVLLLKIGITNKKTRQILISYVSELMDPFVANLTTHIPLCFIRHDIVHFLTEYWDENIEEMFEKWFKTFKVVSSSTDGASSTSRPVETINEDMDYDDEGLRPIAPPPPKKKPKRTKKETGIQLNKKTILKYAFDEIFNRFVIATSSNECLLFVYQRRKYVQLMETPLFINPIYTLHLQTEPSHFAYWYRRDCGIYLSITREYEHHGPSLFSLISINTPPSFHAHGFKLYDIKDYGLKCVILDAFLKTRHFIEACHYNKSVIILLAPIHNLGSNYVKQHKHYVECIQIVPMDLQSSKLSLPRETQKNIHVYPRLFKACNYLYAILCTLSKRGEVDINTPERLIDTMFVSWYNNMRGTMDESNAYTIDEQQVQQTNTNVVDDLAHLSASESVFIQAIRRACTSFRQNVVAEQRERENHSMPLVDHVLQVNNITDALNIYLINEAFNGHMSSMTDGPNVQNISEHQFKYVLSLLSWLIRMGDSHDLAKLTFFMYLHPIKQQLYEEMTKLVVDTCGPIVLHDDIRQLVNYFKSFCQSTTIEVSSEYEDLLPLGYTFNNTGYDGEFLDHIYYGFVGMIIHGQFVSDTVCDLWKKISSFTHRGNTAREALALLNRPCTGKGVFISLLLRMIFPTDVLQSFVNDNLQSCEQASGNTLSMPLNANLLIWFDEVEKLSSMFKLIVNFGVTTERRFFTKERASLRINSHVIISANADPSASDAATQCRIVPIDRQMVFCKNNKFNFKLNRIDCVADLGVQEVNNMLGIQLLLEKFPSGGALDLEALGIFLTTWLCSDMFLNTFSLPVSTKKSKTMQARVDRFRNSASPAQYILDCKYIITNNQDPMSLQDFDRGAANIIKAVRPLLSGNLKSHEVIKELKDLLGKYITGSMIRVAFNPDMKHI